MVKTIKIIFVNYITNFAGVLSRFKFRFKTCFPNSFSLTLDAISKLIKGTILYVLEFNRT